MIRQWLRCWGCFNGAAADQPRKRKTSPTAARKLSWCFNGAAADQPRKLRSLEAGGERDAASMGPRLISRGNRYLVASGLSRQYASMGPRLISRGNFVVRTQSGLMSQRFNGAAADQPRKRHS